MNQNHSLAGKQRLVVGQEVGLVKGRRSLTDQSPEHRIVQFDCESVRIEKNPGTK